MGKLNAKLAMLAMLGAFILAGATCGEAASGYGRGPQFDGQNMQQLTPQQMEQARRIFDDNYTQMEGTRQALNQKRAELDYELNNPNPDSAKIARLSQEIGALRGQMLAARAEARNRLSRQGLPPDCFGPCWGGNGMMNGMMNGYYGWQDGSYNGWHHGGRGKHHGRRGCGW